MKSLVHVMMYEYMLYTLCTETARALPYRLQLSQNLRDSPGFLALVPGPGRPYLNPIACPGSKLVTCTMSRFLLQVIRMSHTTCRTIGYTYTKNIFLVFRII